MIRRDTCLTQNTVSGEASMENPRRRLVEIYIIMICTITVRISYKHSTNSLYYCIFSGDKARKTKNVTSGEIVFAL